jgi:hypothetical protein
MSCLRRSCSATNPKLKVNSSSCSIRVIDGGRLMSRAAADVTNSPWARTGRLVCVNGWGAEIAREGAEEGRTNIDVASSRHVSQCFIHASFVTEVTGRCDASPIPTKFIHCHDGRTARARLRRRALSRRLDARVSMGYFPMSESDQPATGVIIRLRQMCVRDSTRRRRRAAL